MLGCFGRRKKKNKDDKKGKNSAPEQRTADNDRNREPAAGNAVGGKLVTPQIRVESHDQPQGDNSATEAPAEVTETITVTRSQSMHNAPPKPGNIKKAATMSRYDFLRKQDNVNYADRWASLKKRYLAAKTENGDVVSKDDVPELRSANNGAPKSPRRSAVQSLPRQFSPTSSGPPSPVKFSDWFYDRQVKEAEARQEFHEREERMRKIIDGPSNEDLEEAAVRIQAGYKGYRTRKEIKAKQESHEEASPGVDEAAAAEKPQDEEPQEQPAGEAQQDGNPEEEIDLNDPELAQAAIKIQAGFKGYQTRKKLKDEADQPEEQQDEAKEHKDAEEEQQPAAAEEEKADEAKPEAAEADADAEAVDPNDPAQNQAASKIQAGFRGMQARKEVAEMRETHQQEDDSAEANDEEAEPAAANEGEAAPEPEAEDKAEAEAEAEPEAEAKAEAEAEAEPEAEAKSEAEAEGKAEAEAEAEPEAEGKAESEAEDKAEAEAEAEPEAEGKAEAEAEDKAEAEAEPEAEATPEAEAKPEAEAEGEPEAEPEADPEAPPAESAAAAAPGGEEENEAAAPAAADDAAGAEGDEPRDE